jgi:hypothetical protein
MIPLGINRHRIIKKRQESAMADDKSVVEQGKDWISKKENQETVKEIVVKAEPYLARFWKWLTGKK